MILVLESTNINKMNINSVQDLKPNKLQKNIDIDIARQHW